MAKAAVLSQPDPWGPPEPLAEPIETPGLRMALRPAALWQEAASRPLAPVAAEAPGWLGPALAVPLGPDRRLWVLEGVEPFAAVPPAAAGLPAWSERSAGLALFAITGPLAEELWRAGSAVPVVEPAHPGAGSAGCLLAGLPVVAWRQADGLRVVVERPLALHLKAWVRAVLPALPR